MRYNIMTIVVVWRIVLHILYGTANEQQKDSRLSKGGGCRDGLLPHITLHTATSVDPDRRIEVDALGSGKKPTATCRSAASESTRE